MSIVTAVMTAVGIPEYSLDRLHGLTSICCLLDGVVAARASNLAGRRTCCNLCLKHAGSTCDVQCHRACAARAGGR